MPAYHGYPQHIDAHPERPWWRPYTTPLDGRDGWTRHAHDGTTPIVYDPDPMPETLDEYTAWLDDALADADRRMPVPPPPPLCGQVWVEGSIAETVQAVRHGRVYFSASSLDARGSREWPPPNAVLVAEPLSPWAPMVGAE